MLHPIVFYVPMLYYFYPCILSWLFHSCVLARSISAMEAIIRPFLSSKALYPIERRTSSTLAREN